MIYFIGMSCVLVGFFAELMQGIESAVSLFERTCVQSADMLCLFIPAMACQILCLFFKQLFVALGKLWIMNFTRFVWLLVYVGCGWFWPVSIDSVTDQDTLKFVEENLWLIALPQRQKGYDVLGNTHINIDSAKKLADATDRCWAAMLAKDAKAWGEAAKNGFEAIWE